MGGHAAKVAREDIEKNLGESIISQSNTLNYKYLDDNKLRKEKTLDNKQKKLKENNKYKLLYKELEILKPYTSEDNVSKIVK